MQNHQQSISMFLDAWIPELVKSVEMFTGAAVTVEPGDGARVDQLLTSGDSVVWLKQVLEGGSRGAVWIGTPGATCASLTAASAQDTADREALLRELLVQSLAGAAHLLSSGRDPKIVCGDHDEGGSPPDVAGLRALWLTGPEQERMPLFWSLDADLLHLLSVDEPPAAEAPNRPRETSTVIEQLLDLELPVAVVLGRTKMPVRDLIKLTAGSLVELDRRAGDLVDIVVHNVAVAKGEVVSIGGNYGVRIREVISRSERLALRSPAPPPGIRSSTRPVLQ